MIPLLKGGDNSNVSIIHSRITKHFDNLNCLLDNQDGFRSRRSTIDTIASFTDDIALETNQGNCTIAAFVDYKKSL